MKSLLPSIVLLACGGSVFAESNPPVPRIADADFERVHALIKPQPGESPWREINWLVSITEARERAVAEDKPIFVFTAADGSPLGRTWSACTAHRARSCTGNQVEPEFINKHFIPVALDTYFRGNSQELAWCKQIEAGGNHMVAATAGGVVLGKRRSVMRMRQADLQPVLDEYAALPADQKKVALPDPAAATPSRRPMPDPPEHGLILRGFCTYMGQGADGKPERSRKFYYKQNPDAWAAETQSDMLWLTEAEWKTLIPSAPKAGKVIAVAPEIQRRFYCTIGIDYMEGSVNALPLVESAMKLTVTKVSDDTISLRLDGHGVMGKARGPESAGKARTRGCSLRVNGRIEFNLAEQLFTRFDIAGIGRAWGNKMEYTKRAISLGGDTWLYGIATELVTGSRPYDLTPPYNMLHYGHGMKYFGMK